MSWCARIAAMVGTSVLVSTAFAGSAVAAEPALPNTGQSQAEAQFLSGSLLNGVIPFNNLLALRGASATNSGQASSATQRNNLLVTLFGLPIINQPNGIPVNLGTGITGGLANQYAQASPGGSSRAASGALSDSGVFGDNGSSSFPSNATINLSAMQGPGAFPGLSDVALTLGAISSEAALTAGNVPSSTCTDQANPTNCLDYSLASGTFSFTSTDLAGIPTAVSNALAPIDAQTAIIESTIKSVVQTFDTGNAALNAVLSVLGGGSHLSVSVNLALKQAVLNALATPISAGGVSIDVTTGKVTVDLGSFVKLNKRAPNTTLANGEELLDISPAITALTAAINQRITAATDAALSAGHVVIHSDLTLPLNAASFNLDVNASLLSLANGTATASITVKVLGIPTPPLDVTTLLTPLKAIAASVVGTVNTAVQSLQTSLTAGVAAVLQNQIKPATLALPDFLKLTANVQSQPTPGVYEVTALQVAINTPFGNLAVINFATSRVGANSLGATPLARTAATQGVAPAPPTPFGPVAADMQNGAVASPVAGTVVKTTAGTVAVPDAVSAQVAPAAGVSPASPLSSADVVNAANTAAVSPEGPETHWWALTVLLTMITLTTAAVLRMRRSGSTEGALNRRR